MNIKLTSAGIGLGLAVLALLPRAADAAAVIDLGPAAAATAEDEAVLAVETRFEERGKLFALVPVRLTATVRVLPGGEVILDYPWYSRLTLDKREKLATELKVAADSALRSLAVGKVTAATDGAPKERFSAEEAAAVAAAVSRVLEENAGEETR
jgi:hypothetical protein